MDGTVGSEATEEDDILAEFTDEELAEAAVSGAGLTEGGRSPRERKKAGRILGAAASVFARRGYSEARMDDVAEEAGVSKGGLYLHFPSKDALFDGLVGYLVGLEARRLKAARAAEGPVADRLAGFFHEYTCALARMARFYPIIMEFYARSFRHAPLRRAMQKHIDVYVAELAALVREGVASGEFRQVDEEEVALHLISLLEGLALVWGVDPERVQIPETADRGVRLVLDGLLAR
jgi:AcrR family transcriptional regulator